MPSVAYPHVVVGLDGIATIAGTKTKVVEIVMDRLAFHWDADEIQRQHPHLTLGAVYGALAFYYDNQAEIDGQIEDRLRREDEILTRIGESPLRAKLLAARAARRTP